MRFVGCIFPGYISPVCILPRYVSTAEAGYISPEFTTMDTSLHCPVSLFHSWHWVLFAFEMNEKEWINIGRMEVKWLLSRQWIGLGLDKNAISVQFDFGHIGRGQKKFRYQRRHSTQSVLNPDLSLHTQINTTIELKMRTCLDLKSDFVYFHW